jgi:hypothetical protein
MSSTWFLLSFLITVARYFFCSLFAINPDFHVQWRWWNCAK